MMSLDIALIKELRALTHAPLKDVKEALSVSEGDMEKAKLWLREKGLSKAAKKADRETNEWVIKTRFVNGMTYVLALACETDFVARNEQFHAIAEGVLDKIISLATPAKSLADIPADFVESDLTPLVHEWVATIGENVQIADIAIIEWEWFVYTHPGDKLVSVVCASDISDPSIKDIALQVAAMNPQYLSIESVPEDIRLWFTNVLAEAEDLAGKPDDIVEKIVAWRLSKKYAEIVLMEQPSIKDEAQKIKSILPDGVVIDSYYRFSI